MGQEGDHHAKGHPARAKDPRRARLKRLPPQRSLLHPQFLIVRRFSRRNQSAARTAPSKKRGYRHQCQCSLQTLRLLNAAPMETLRTGDFACWVHLALKKRVAAGPCLPGIPWWRFVVWKWKECNG